MATYLILDTTPMKKLFILSLTLLLNTNLTRFVTRITSNPVAEKKIIIGHVYHWYCDATHGRGTFFNGHNLAGTLGTVAGTVSATTVVGMTYGTPLVSTTAVFNYFSAKRYLWVKQF